MDGTDQFIEAGALATLINVAVGDTLLDIGLEPLLKSPSAIIP